MPEITLRVNDQEYGGWKSVSVTRGIEAVSGSFELSVSERWGRAFTPWPIYEEDECEVLVDGVTVLTGYVDRRSLAYGSGEHSFSVSGRDRTGDLVDCSAVLSKWEFQNVPLLTLADQLCRPFGIAVTVQSGLDVPKPPGKLTIDPGESAFEALERLCRLAGLLPVSDGMGGLVLTRAGSLRATTQLVEGQNILSASAEFDASNRFRSYRVVGQHQGLDSFFGASAARVKGAASDSGVRRASRVLLIRPEGMVTGANARTRAEWEATVRAARADSVSLTVQGWQQADGSLWPVNALADVRSERLGVNATLLITQATYEASEAGTLTRLTLRRPDAFRPEPVVPAVDPLTRALG